MRARVVVESNVYVSALVFGRKARKAIEELGLRGFERLISSGVIAEVEGVLFEEVLLVARHY